MGGERVGLSEQRLKQCQDLLECDRENAWPSSLALEDEPMESLLTHSITYLIVAGPRAGRKAFTLQSLPAGDRSGEGPDQARGFSLHAGAGR